MKITYIGTYLKWSFVFFYLGSIIHLSWSQNAVEPNYSKLKYWAAHPKKNDPSDRLPNNNLSINAEGDVDVFFIHPTTYTKKKENKSWNANIENEELNQKTLETSILHQASIFNGAGRVFAPFYRQAHLTVYGKKGATIRKEALEFAYKDVKKAFEYFLNFENNGRPIIIASHSQGTNHGEQLLKEFFDGTTLKKQLVAAYLVGMPIKASTFDSIGECENELETNCFCSWRTFK